LGACRAHRLDWLCGLHVFIDQPVEDKAPLHLGCGRVGDRCAWRRWAAPDTGPGRPSARTTGRRSAAANTASRAGRGTVAARAAAGQPAAGRRVYRRMPEVYEVLGAYHAAGGTTALARHFGVPRHTASGWPRRLRSMGLLD
jgi:hypothetical protein